MAFDSIEDIIADIREGKMVVLVDDEDRENEGDLVMASQWVRPEDINFMARYGRGLVCMTLTRERCEKLQLPLMVSDTNDKHGTNFTLSIEASKGVTTGISAADRAVTVRSAIAADAVPEDIVQPGHIFPIMAQPGGVLNRAGHTEAGCDLARLADLEPSAVIVEILNEDGSMARRPDLEIFAQTHNLRMGTIADLIEYRVKNEKIVDRVAVCHLPIEFGEFELYAYRDQLEDEVHLALVFGEIKPDEPTLVRVQIRDDMSDVLGGQRDALPKSMRSAMAHIAREGQGIAVLIRKREDASEFIRRLRNCQLEDKGGVLPQSEASQDLRTYGVGAQILSDLGVTKMRIIGMPRKMHGLAGFGLEVVDFVRLE